MLFRSLIKKLADIRTPNPNSGFSVPSNTTTSHAPTVFEPHPAYYSKEDPLAEEPLEGGTFLEFGDSGRSLDIANSVASEIVDKEGHAYKVRRLESTNRGLAKEISH